MAKKTQSNTTSIVLIVDRSGSMASINDATTDALTEFINGQLLVEGDLTIDTVFFDDKYEERAVKVDPRKEELDLVINPRGMTAMHDAIGRKINSFADALREDSEKPDTILFVIATDGMENASLEYNAPTVAKLIEEKQADGWNFTFIGANQDAVKTAETLNISKDSAITFSASDAGVGSVLRGVSTYATALRSGKAAFYSDEDRAAALEDE